MGGSDRAGRQFAQGLDNSSSGTYYLGFLYQQATTLAGYRGFSLYDGSVSSGNRVFNVFADSSVSGELDISNDFTGGAGSAPSSTIDANVNFFVFEFTMSTGSLADSVALYKNPDLASGPDAGSLIFSASGMDVAFDFIGMERFTGSGASYTNYIDEIRMSQTYNDVSTVPVPESSAYTFFVGMITAVLMTTMRRRKA